ncbi:MAG TPA: NAD(P)H-binding protein [Thermoanaerobaculia bacterium]
MARRHVFVTGGTGYLGRRVIPELLARGHAVRALAREGSAPRLPEGCEPVSGDALDASTFAARVPPCDTLLQLVGVAHPSPAKAALFRTVDLASLRASVEAAAASRISHFVYVSVAHPAPAMKAYWQARAEGEDVLRASGVPATILRPWYVLGPGHRWPYALLPFYWILERLPPTRAGARRLGLVTLAQMVRALVAAVESESPPAAGPPRIVEVPEIRSGSVVRSRS